MTLIVLGCAWKPARSATPQQINYQGYLKNNGAPVHTPSPGSTPMLFDLYDNSVGGALLCSSGVVAVPVNYGRFNFAIGSVGCALSGIDWQNTTVYLQVTVNGTALTPRERIIAAAYALSSESTTGNSFTLDADNAGAGVSSSILFNRGSDSLGLPAAIRWGEANDIFSFTTDGTSGAGIYALGVGYLDNFLINSQNTTATSSLLIRNGAMGGFGVNAFLEGNLWAMGGLFASNSMYASGTVYADYFVGDGSGITGIAPTGALLLTGGAMSGPLYMNYTTATASLHIINNSTGGNTAVFENTGGTAATATVLVKTNNTSATSWALQAQHSGAGDALYALNSGTGEAVYALNSGTSGRAGLFTINNAVNTNPVLNAVTLGTGRAGMFQISNVANSSHALQATTMGTGAALYGFVTGNGTIVSGDHAGVSGNLMSLSSTGSPRIVVEKSGNVFASGTFQSAAANSFAAPVGGYLNFGATLGTGGYGFRDNAGSLEFKDNGGGWIDISSLGGAGAYVSDTGDTMAGSLVINADTATTSLHIVNNGNGSGLVVDNTGNTAATSSLFVSTNNTTGASYAVNAFHSGAGRAGYFQIGNAGNTVAALTGITNGTAGTSYGVVGQAAGSGVGVMGSSTGVGSGVSGTSNTGDGVYGYLTGDANAVHGYTQGLGSGVKGETDNTGYAIFGLANSAGTAVYGENMDLGHAGFFETINPANATDTLYILSNSTPNNLFGGNHAGGGNLIMLTTGAGPLDPKFAVDVAGNIYASGTLSVDGGISGVVSDTGDTMTGSLVIDTGSATSSFKVTNSAGAGGGSAAVFTTQDANNISSTIYALSGAATATIYAENTEPGGLGLAIAGISPDSIGVFAQSDNYIAVYADSTNGIGVYGNSTMDAGVYGLSSFADGLHGESVMGHAGAFIVGNPGSSTDAVYINTVSTGGGRGLKVLHEGGAGGGPAAWLEYNEATNATATLYLSNNSTNAASALIFGNHSGTNGDLLRLQSGGGDMFVVDRTGELSVNGSAGAAGEVLTSGGAGVAPAWAAPGAVSGFVSDTGDTMSGSLVIAAGTATSTLRVGNTMGAGGGFSAWFENAAALNTSPTVYMAGGAATATLYVHNDAAAAPNASGVHGYMSGIGKGVIGETDLGMGVFGQANGLTGRAGYFTNTNVLNATATLITETAGLGYLIESRKNSQPLFIVDNSGNIFASGTINAVGGFGAISGFVSDTGDQMTGPLNIDDNAIATSTLSVYQRNNTDGAAHIQTINGGSATATLQIYSDGAGPLLYGNNITGSGPFIDMADAGNRRFYVDDQGAVYATGTINTEASVVAELGFVAGVDTAGETAFSSTQGNANGIYINNPGTQGKAAEFIVSSGGNTNPVLKAVNQGPGSAAWFENDAAPATDTVYITTNSNAGGSGLKVAQTGGIGNGPAARFENNNSANSTATIFIANNSTDANSALIFGNHSGTGGDLLRLQSGGSDMFVLDRTGEIIVNGDAGAAGEVLTSGGPGFPPTWAPAGGGSFVETIGGSMTGSLVIQADTATASLYVKNSTGGGGTTLHVDGFNDDTVMRVRQMGGFIATSTVYIEDNRNQVNSNALTVRKLVEGNVAQFVSLSNTSATSTVLIQSQSTDPNSYSLKVNHDSNNGIALGVYSKSNMPAAQIYNTNVNNTFMPLLDVRSNNNNTQGSALRAVSTFNESAGVFQTMHTNNATATVRIVNESDQTNTIGLSLDMKGTEGRGVQVYSNTSPGQLLRIERAGPLWSATPTVYISDQNMNTAGVAFETRTLLGGGAARFFTMDWNNATPTVRIVNYSTQNDATGLSIDMEGGAGVALRLVNDDINSPVARFENNGFIAFGTTTVLIRSEFAHTDASALRAEHMTNGAAATFETLNWANATATVHIVTNSNQSTSSGLLAQSRGMDGNTARFESLDTNFATNTLFVYSQSSQPGNTLIGGDKSSTSGNLIQLSSGMFVSQPKFVVDAQGNVYASGTISVSGGNLVKRTGDGMSGSLIIDADSATASLHIVNNSTGSGLIVDNMNNNAATASLYVATNNTNMGSFALHARHTGVGTAIYGSTNNNTTGAAAIFESTNNLNATNTVFITTDSTNGGIGLKVTQTGGFGAGQAAWYESTDPNTPASTIYATSNAATATVYLVNTQAAGGRALYGLSTNGSIGIYGEGQQVGSTGVYGLGWDYGVSGISTNGVGVYGSTSTGDGVRGESTTAGVGVYGRTTSNTTGAAARFETFNNANATNTVYITTNSTTAGGHALRVDHSGSGGNVAYFKTTSNVSSNDTVKIENASGMASSNGIEVTASLAGGPAGFFQSTNAAFATATVFAYSESTNAGSALYGGDLTGNAGMLVSLSAGGTTKFEVDRMGKLIMPDTRVTGLDTIAIATSCKAVTSAGVTAGSNILLTVKSAGAVGNGGIRVQATTPGVNFNVCTMDGANAAANIDFYYLIIN